MLTERGDEVAVILGIEDYRQLNDGLPEFRQYLRNGPTAELTITRSSEGPREIDFSDD